MAYAKVFALLFVALVACSQVLVADAHNVEKRSILECLVTAPILGGWNIMLIMARCQSEHNDHFRSCVFKEIAEMFGEVPAGLKECITN